MFKHMLSSLNRISVRGRVSGGFGLLLLLLIGTSLIYDHNLRNVRETVGDIDSAALGSDALIQFSRDFLEARRLILAYLRTPGAAELLDARKAQNAINGEAEKLATVIGDESSKIRSEIGAFGKSFDRLADNMAARQKALATLTANGARLTNIGVTMAVGLASEHHSAASAIRFNQAIQALIEASLHFVIQPNPGDADIIRVETDRIDTEFALLKADPPPTAPLTAMIDQLVAPIDKIKSASASLVTLSAEFETDLAETTVIGQQIGKVSDDMRAKRLALRNDSIANAGSTIAQVLMAGIVTSAVVIGVGILLAFIISYSIAALMKRSANVMTRLAKGDLTTEVHDIERGDEIGLMARAAMVFKESAIEKVQLEASAASARRNADQERAAREAEKAEEGRQDQFAIVTLGEGLGRLADGDLAYRIDQPFAPKAEKLRVDFNASVEKLQQTMLTVRVNTQAIGSGTGEIATATDDLSRRTEQQAASLEETAAALDEITATVKKTAEGAGHAREVVATTKAGAERSAAVVREAIEAMSQIEKSSQQIGQIIGLIDEIAFQTNLLALNAGVEAARAGEAGRGFAVVASEVRALAQRSTSAAKEIKALITSSGQQVEQGVDRVAATGEALALIVTQVSEINQVVAEIAASSHEQATALHEVNTAINQMDQATQQNAAMVEQSTAAAHALSEETEELRRLIETFRVGAQDAASKTPRRGSHRAAA
jgi:methyl-accepting chemotaxis protein